VESERLELEGGERLVYGLTDHYLPVAGSPSVAQ